MPHGFASLHSTCCLPPVQTDGWPMKRWEYFKLVEKARRNMME